MGIPPLGDLDFYVLSFKLYHLYLFFYIGNLGTFLIMPFHVCLFFNLHCIIPSSLEPENGFLDRLLIRADNSSLHPKDIFLFFWSWNMLYLAS